MSSHQNPFYQLPHEILFSGIYPYLLQSAPYIIENHENNVTKYLYDRYWIRFLNTSKIFMRLKKSTRYILLKTPTVVSKFMQEDSFRTYLFSLVCDRAKQIGVHLEDWYRNQPIYSGTQKGSFFFPTLNELHYVNLSSVYTDMSDNVQITSIAYLSISSMDLNKISLLGNIISLSLAHCYHLDLRSLPTSIRILSLVSCDIDCDSTYLSKNLEKLDISNCRGLTKKGIESLTYLKSFYFSTSTFRPFNHQSDSHLTEVDFSIYSNIPEIKISFYPAINDFNINCFKNVVSLTLIESMIPRISCLRCVEYLNVEMRGGQESKSSLRISFRTFFLSPWFIQV
jgi:hypothetical protein